MTGEADDAPGYSERIGLSQRFYELADLAEDESNRWARRGIRGTLHATLLGTIALIAEHAADEVRTCTPERYADLCTIYDMAGAEPNHARAIRRALEAIEGTDPDRPKDSN